MPSISLPFPARDMRAASAQCLAFSLSLPLEMPIGSTSADATWNSPMIDFVAARRMMVDGQVRTSDVTDLRLIAAMLERPREHFLPDTKAGLAYLDLDLPMMEGEARAPARYLLKPMVLAKLIQAAAIIARDHVLDVGCGSGYSAAILARLAGSVVALEQEPLLARQAAENLQATGAANVTVVTGPLSLGWAAGAPYDAIL